MLDSSSPAPSGAPLNDYGGYTYTGGEPHPVAAAYVGGPIAAYYGNSVYVGSPGEFGNGGGAAQVPTSATTSTPGVMTGGGYRDLIQIQLNADTYPNGATVPLVVNWSTGWHQKVAVTWSDNSVTYWWKYFTASGFQKTNLVITRNSATMDAAIDTRKTYGQPNKDGELPADPNAEPRNPNFGDWIWKGGLFVGNMPYGSNDLSGTGRTQLRFSGVPSGATVGCLSILYKGKPSVAQGNFTIGIYTPASTDPNLSVGEGTLTWESRWGIAPRAPGNPTIDLAQDPMSTVATANLVLNDYACWLFSPSSLTGLNPGALTQVCLALDDEQTKVNSGFTGWVYFTSKESQSGNGLTFPDTDGAPRIWTATFQGWTTW